MELCFILTHVLLHRTSFAIRSHGFSTEADVISTYALRRFSANNVIATDVFEKNESMPLK